MVVVVELDVVVVEEVVDDVDVIPGDVVVVVVVDEVVVVELPVKYTGTAPISALSPEGKAPPI